jgi:hypothetical protein
LEEFDALALTALLLERVTRAKTELNWLCRLRMQNVFGNRSLKPV